MTYFIDSNIFIYASTPNPRAVDFERFVLQGTQTDALVLIETYAKLRTIMKDDKAARKVVRNIMRSYDVIPVTATEVFKAMKRTDLSISDAIHAVCCEEAEMVTADKALAKACGVKPALRS